MKRIIPIMVMLLVLGIVAISGCTDSGKNTNNSVTNTNSGTDTKASPISVTDLKVAKGSYGMWSITCQIKPNKDISYLEMTAIWYDKDGAVIETSPLLWNVNDAKSGQVYKAKGDDPLYEKGTPTKVDVLIFDSVFSGGDTSDAIFKQTVTI